MNDAGFGDTEVWRGASAMPGLQEIEPTYQIGWRASCSKRGMAIILGAVAFLSGSFVLMLGLLRRAPEGYQNEQGFRFLDRSPASTDDALSQTSSLAQASRKVA